MRRKGLGRIMGRKHFFLFSIIVCQFLTTSFISADSKLRESQLDLPTGIHMNYVETGTATGEKVLLLHGYTDTKRSYYPTITELTRLRPDLHIFALDLRGHGGSSMPPGKHCLVAPEQCFRFSDFAADVLAFMELKKIDVAHVVGHSMGSIVAQELALTAPRRFARMVLIATGADLRNNPVIAEFLLPVLIDPWKKALMKKGYRFPEDVYNLTALDADPAARKLLSENWVAEPLADPAFLAAVLPETLATSLGTWIGCLRSLDQVNNADRLKNLKVTTLVIWATQDNVFTMKDQTILRNSLSVAAERHGTRYFWKQYGKKPLPESGIPEGEIAHNTQWAAPVAVAADLAAFLMNEGEPVRNLPCAAKSGDRTIISLDDKAIIVEGPQTDQ
jgi:non-heme chloroperoxidase